jgi:homoserine dehydrogenase
MPKQVPIVLTGFGNVGRAFLKLAREKHAFVRERYGLDLKIVAAFRSTGGAMLDDDPGAATFAASPELKLETLPTWTPGLRLVDVLDGSLLGVLAETTPSNLKTGEPGLGYMRAALNRGWNIAAASKGALSVNFAGLMEIARRQGLSIKFSGATAASLPTLDVATISLSGAEILGIDGILTGTTNHILGRLEEGLTFDAALREAQILGIAEPDPSMDIDGWDTACKLQLIVNAALGMGLTLGDLAVQGIRDVTPESQRAARAEGKILKLIGRMTRDGDHFRASVAPVAIEASHPLYRVHGTNKGIAFFTDTMGTVVVTGGKSDPRGTAASMLKDIINIYR